MRKTSRSLQRRESFVGLLFALPSLIGILVFFLVPFSVAVYISFTQSTHASGAVGFGNYLDMLQNRTFLIAIWNTVRFIIVAVPLIMVLSLAVALMLYQKYRSSRFFCSVFIFPLVLPISSVVLFFQIIFSSDGLINRFVAVLGFSATNWLQSESAFTVLVMLYIWKNCGYNIILLLAALNSVPKEYYEVVSLETNSTIKKLWYVTLPIISPYIFFIICLSIINTFKSFREAYILCGEHPHTSIYMIQHFMSNNINNLNYPRLSVAAILVFLATIVMILLALRFRTQAIEREI